jgi:hypothetical protein
MKEIDFLPQWYRQKRRSQSNYRIQYFCLVCLAVVMSVWTAAELHAIAGARAHLETMRASQASKNADITYTTMKTQFQTLHVYADILTRIDPHLRISAVIGELSSVTGAKVKFSRIHIQAEKFPQKDAGPEMPANTIRAVREAMTDKSGPWEGDIRFKVTMTGIASDATHVAALVHRLEQSPWFSRVTPSYCKNSTVNEHVVSQFEITCYIANYVEPRAQAAKATATSGTDQGGGT